jgi:hypothetical protein
MPSSHNPWWPPNWVPCANAWVNRLADVVNPPSSTATAKPLAAGGGQPADTFGPQGSSPPPMALSYLSPQAIANSRPPQGGACVGPTCYAYTHPVLYTSFLGLTPPVPYTNFGYQRA